MISLSSLRLFRIDRICILFLLVIIFIPGKTFGQWTKISIGADQTLTHITHVASDTFYIAGFQGLYKTYNAGATWSNSAVDITASYFYDMHFFNSKVGIGVGPITMANSQCIVKTIDGGQHWSIVSIDNGGEWPREFNDIEFTNASTGYAVGRNGKVLKTTNKGDSWNIVPVLTFSTNNFLGVTFDAPNHGYLLSTPWLEDFDGTNNPRTELNSLNSSFVAAKAFSASEIMVASKAKFSHKRNGTWTTYDFPYGEVTSMFVYSAEIIYLGTDNGLYISRNGGELWEFFKETRGMDVTSIFVRNDGKGYVVGEDGKAFETNNFGGPSSPIVDFATDVRAYCDVTTIYLRNKTHSGYQFKWYLNDKLISTHAQDSIRLTKFFDGTISLVADNGQTTDTVTRPLVVSVLSVKADAGNDIHACYGENVTLDASASTGYIYKWSPATGLSDPQIVNPVSNYASKIKYVLSVSNVEGCVDKDTITVFRSASIPSLEWERTDVTTEKPVRRVQMLNDTLGYAVAWSKLLMTTDGGSHWTEKPNPIPEVWGDYFSDLQFITADTGFVVCRFSFKTTNGGETYDQNNMLGDGIYDIEFIDAKVGYAVVASMLGDYYTIVKTIDGGETWTVQTGVRGLIHKISCQDNGTCVAVGAEEGNALFLISTDGEHWQKANYPAAKDHLVYDAYFVNGMTGYAVSELFKVWKTTDGGASWKIDHTLPDVGMSIEFADENIGFIGSYNGKLFQTVNGGACWQNMGVVHTTWIRELHIHKNYIFMAGGETVFENGVIYRADLTRINHVLETENPHRSTALFFNPNPVVQRVNIDLSEFSIGQPLRIEIVDSFGRKVLQQQSVGHNELTLDIGNLTSGIYYLIVKQNAASKTGRLVKQ